MHPDRHDTGKGAKKSASLIHRQQEMNCVTRNSLRIGDIKAYPQSNTLSSTMSYILNFGTPYELIVANSFS